MQVTFFLAGEDDLGHLARLDPEADWRHFVRGEHAWILQSYLRLARAGHPVRLADEAPGEGLVVFHAKQKRQLARQQRRLGSAVLVGVRGDHHQVLAADFEILQNGFYHDGRSRFALPHWPQAGLVPREGGRGTAVRRIGYKGFAANLHPALRGEAWRSFLAGRGIEWEVDATVYAGRQTRASELDWNDYSQVDLVVALRPLDRRLHTGKPATKLINAWRAGVPAILGPEVAYRELRRSDLDYLEAADRAEAQAAVERLAGDPQLYRAMVANGHRRSQELSFEATTRRWAELLFETLPPLAAPIARGRRYPLPLRIAGRRLLRWATLRPAR